MKILLAGLALASLLLVAGCRSSGNVDTGTGDTPSGGLVPAQTPQ